LNSLESEFFNSLLQCDKSTDETRLMMARPLRSEFSHAVYHLAGRGNARQKIYFSELRAVRPKLEKILKRSDDWEIVQVYKDYGYRLREIAAHLGVHYATVSRKRKKSRGGYDIVGLQDMTPRLKCGW
jgi:hypothetical protein